MRLICCVVSVLIIFFCVYCFLIRIDAKWHKFLAGLLSPRSINEEKAMIDYKG